MKSFAAVAVSCALLLPGAAQASVISNGLFASTCGSANFCTYNAGNSTDIPSWTVINGGAPTDSNGSVDLITGYWQAPPAGGNSIDLDGNAFGGVAQTFATIVGQQYKVSFYLSGNPDGGSPIRDLGVSTGFASQTYSYLVTGNKASMNWALQTFSFTALSSLTTLSFTSLDSFASSPGVFGPALGGVDVEEAPEPGALAMMAIGLLALLGCTSLRRRRAA